jgi:hypothetical protein
MEDEPQQENVKDRCKITKDEAKLMRHGGRMKQERKINNS